MKKALLVFTIFAGILSSASAQCTADSTHFTSSKHVYPDSLPCIITGQRFSGTVSLQVPATIDAHEFFSQAPAGTLTANIDSIQIVSIAGYPAGITSVSNPAIGPTSRWLHPGDIACALFSGSTTAAAGNYPLTITGNGCGHATIPLAGQRDSCINNFNFSRIYPYTLKVCYPAGVTEVSEGVNLSIYPNPNQGAFTVSISASDHISGDMTVIDALGRTIHTQAVDVTGTRQIALELGHVSAGSYALIINTANGKSVKQFIVK